MSIKIGTTDVKELSCGKTYIQSAYVGLDLVMQGTNFLTVDKHMIVLKDGKVFNVKE